MAKVQRRRLEDNYTFQGDGISMLPDDILVLILSSLTLKEAARTGTLCSRWRYLWTLTPTLDLHIDWVDRLRNCDRDELRRKYVEWVDRLLTKLPKASTTNLVKFRVLFDLSSYFSDRINDWLSYAVSRKVESIDLTLKANLPINCYPFPYKQGNFPDNLKLLKKLSFSYVNVSCEAVAFLLGNCCLLEQLSLCRCPLSSLEVIQTSPVFKCLEISQCRHLNSVVVYESKVACIKYAGAGKPRCHFELVDVPFLTELWIRAKAQKHYIYAITNILSMFGPVLPQLHTLKMYSMSNHTRRDTLSDVKMMPNLKELVVVLGSDYSDDYSLLPIIRWFSIAPCLQRFVIEASHQEISEADKKEVMHSPKRFSKYCFCKRRRDYSPIKEVEFIGYRGVYNHFQMIEQLITYSLTLVKITVDPRSFELCKNMPWDYISRNQMEDELFARNRAKDQFKYYATSRINVNIL